MFLNVLASYSSDLNKCSLPGEKCLHKSSSNNYYYFNSNSCIKGYSCQLLSIESESSNNNKQFPLYGGGDDDDNNVEDRICKPILKHGEICPNGEFSICEPGLKCLQRKINDFSIGDNSNNNNNNNNNNKKDDLNYYCLDYEYAEIYESCEYSHQCIGNSRFNISCINNLCIYDTSNKYYDNDEDDYNNNYNPNLGCRSHYSCPPQQYCNKNSGCIPLEPINGNCENSGNCFIGGICSKNGKCIERYKSKLNESCFFDEECDFGLKCQHYLDIFFPNGTINRTDDYFKCVPLTISKTNNCIKDDCLFNEICNIETNNCIHHKNLTIDCKNAEKERDNCYTINKCQFSNIDYDSPFENERACAIGRCKYETKLYFEKCKSLYNIC